MTTEPFWEGKGLRIAINEERVKTLSVAYKRKGDVWLKGKTN